ncbi:MAG: polysaccharide biosynthesis/export family protein [Bacteroidota bacterium]
MNNIGLGFKMGIYFMALLLLAPSCVGHRELITINGNETVPENFRVEEEVSNTKLFPFEPYRIREFDQLMIRINAFDGSTEDFLNREFSIEGINTNNINYDPESLYFNSYVVNDSGMIHLPMLGGMEVIGLTLHELKLKLDEDYSAYLKFASTTVKLANMRITVLGEVGKPGVHYLYNERTTILDAISMAGDFTDFGNREKVKLIRQTYRNAKAVYLNLNRADFLYTHYYYVQPSDVIYVEPIKSKSLKVSSATLGVVISAISLGALIINIFVK